MAIRAWTGPANLLRVARRQASLEVLTASLALSLLASPAVAQLAPNAHPLGGQVVAGSASISSTLSTTTINQSSQRAAINWQSFNVGSQQTVDFAQPSASAVALNRVTGPNPSQIAGRITANGQVVIVNQSGLTFDKGSQINAAGLVVSAAGITDQNFMAGKMVFDQPGKPNAQVSNEGKITIKQAGLAALVAPSVVNSGVITARLGHVVLAGATEATLDLYGDGLVSIDVSGAVKQAPAGPDGKPVSALVTNSGVIQANGGTVQLTARETDGLVQNLVQADGKITANTVGGKTGTIVLNGVGGSIVVIGQLDAEGVAAGTAGGHVVADSAKNVTLTSTARINASGKAGGGVVAIGTTLARATGGPSVKSTVTAQNVSIDPGATIAANATSKGNGGRVSVLSTGTTTMNGTISAEGGPNGGNGGFVETSGAQVSDPDGKVYVSAPDGAIGTWLLDPSN